MSPEGPFVAAPASHSAPTLEKIRVRRFWAVPQVRTDRILIVRLSAIGDVVHAIPVLVALRRRFPHSFIAWVVEEKSKDVVEGHPMLNELIVFPKAEWKTDLTKQRDFGLAFRRLRGFARELRSRRFDLAIDLQGLQRSGLITYFSGAPVRIGFADAREFSHIFYNLKIPAPGNLHVVERYFLAAKFLGAEDERPCFVLPVSPGEQRFARAFLSRRRRPRAPLVGIFPGASLAHKRWAPRGFAELSDLVQETLGAEVLLIGSKYEQEITAAILRHAQRLPLLADGEVSIKQMAALISRCDLLIGNDTGALHIAVALGVPVIGLYGPYDPRHTGPYSESCEVIYHRYPCSPCIRHPICQNFDCMREITVGEVLAAADRLLRGAVTAAAPSGGR